MVTDVASRYGRVVAVSSTNAWAVGFYYEPGPLGQNLALHCC